MRDYISIGSTPTGEDCAQVGSADYYEQTRKEQRAFINQLKRVLGEPPCGAHLASKTFDHDFGTYHEVVCYFDEGNEEARDYAFKLEGEAPEYWDELARKELEEAGYVWRKPAKTTQ